MKKRIIWSILLTAAAGFGIGLAAYLGADRTLILILSIGLMLAAILLAGAVAAYILRPLSGLDLEKPGEARRYRELEPLLSRLTRQGQLIDLQMDDLRRSQEEFRAITDNMAEGFLLIDTNMNLLSYNASAQRMMGDEGLTASGPVREAAEKALTGLHNEATLTVDGRVYQILANPVGAGDRVAGAVLVSLDITEKAQREAMRRDFSSNVSHELKTPLTSIYGISELMVNGMVKPEDVTSFAKSIHDESGRLITLINDIIKLSELDDYSFDMERADTDIHALAGDVIRRLSPVAAERGVTMTLRGSPAMVHGIPSILDEMIYNLCDNAVKYNVENGSVTVSAAVIGGRPVLSVADTGIGIPPEHIDRVFERFYRVDKSHSKEIGGTGLGLSIVKHGAAYHNAEVSVKSRVGHGTVVTITFEKSNI